MSRTWLEVYYPRKHSNKMKGIIDGAYQYDFDYSAKDNLIEKKVIFVEVCNFTFSFFSLRQLEICIEYFSIKLKGSG